MYNRYRFNPEYKRAVEREIVIADITKRIALRECKRNFTLEKLLECRKDFQKYVKTYGDDKPVQTGFGLLDTLGNGLLSYSHFIRTNQPYARSIVAIIDEAKANDRYHEAVAVDKALKKIKDVHNKMVAKRITGDVRTYIEETLKKFNYDTNLTIFEEQQDKIFHILKYIDQLDDDIRIYTPTCIK